MYTAVTSDVSGVVTRQFALGPSKFKTPKPRNEWSIGRKRIYTKIPPVGEARLPPKKPRTTPFRILGRHRGGRTAELRGRNPASSHFSDEDIAQMQAATSRTSHGENLATGVTADEFKKYMADPQSEEGQEIYNRMIEGHHEKSRQVANARPKDEQDKWSNEWLESINEEGLHPEERRVYQQMFAASKATNSYGVNSSVSRQLWKDAWKHQTGKEGIRMWARPPPVVDHPPKKEFFPGSNSGSSNGSSPESPQDDPGDPEDDPVDNPAEDFKTPLHKKRQREEPDTPPTTMIRQKFDETDLHRLDLKEERFTFGDTNYIDETIPTESSRYPMDIENMYQGWRLLGDHQLRAIHVMIFGSDRAQLDFAQVMFEFYSENDGTKNWKDIEKKLKMLLKYGPTAPKNSPFMDKMSTPKKLGARLAKGGGKNDIWNVMLEPRVLF